MELHFIHKIDIAAQTYFDRVRVFGYNVRALLLSTLLSTFGLAAWGLMFNLYLKEFGYNNEQIARVSMCSNIALSLCALPAGLVLDRIGHKRALIISQIVAGLFFILAICNVSSLNAVFVTVFVAHAATALGRVMVAPFIMHNTKSSVERTYVFSFMSATGLVGAFFGNMCFGMLKDVVAGEHYLSLDAYRMVMIAGVVVSLLGLIPTWRIHSKHPERDKNVSLDVLHRKDWAFLVKATTPPLFVGVGAGLIVQFMNLYFRDSFHASDSSIGLFMGMQSVMMALGLYLVPAISERMGRLPTVVGSQLLSIPFMLILGFTTNINVAAVALVVRAMLMNMAWPVSNSIVMELCPPRKQSVLNALFMVMQGTGWAISAWIFGTVVHGDYRWSFVVAAVLYVISSFLFYFFFRHADGLHSHDGLH